MFRYIFINYILTCFARGCAGKSDNSCLYPVNLAGGIRICKDVKCFYRSLLSEGTKRMPDAPERRSQTCTSETCPRREPIHHNDILCIWEKKVLFKKNCYTKPCNIFHQPLIQVHPFSTSIRQIGFVHFLSVCYLHFLRSWVRVEVSQFSWALYCVSHVWTGYRQLDKMTISETN